MTLLWMFMADLLCSERAALEGGAISSSGDNRRWRWRPPVFCAAYRQQRLPASLDRQHACLSIAPAPEQASDMGKAVTIYGIKNCDTMAKARAWLDARGVAYAVNDYRVEGVERGRIEAWAGKVGWERLLNRAS